MPARVRAPAHSTSHGHQLSRRAAAVGHAGNSSSTNKRWLWKRQQTPPVGERRTLATAATVAATTPGPPAPAHSGPTTTATAGPQNGQHDGAPKTAASSAGSNTQRKPAPLAPAHVAATGGRSTESGGRRRGGAETAPRHHCTQQRRPGGGSDPHRGRQLQRTATAAEPGERRHSPPDSGGPGPATAAPTEPRTATRTGNRSNGLLETL